MINSNKNLSNSRPDGAAPSGLNLSAGNDAPPDAASTPRSEGTPAPRSKWRWFKPKSRLDGAGGSDAPDAPRTAKGHSASDRSMAGPAGAPMPDQPSNRQQPVDQPSVNQPAADWSAADRTSDGQSSSEPIAATPAPPGQSEPDKPQQPETQPEPTDAQTSGTDTAHTMDQRARLREIISVLSRHNIVRGLTPEKLRLILTDLGPTFVKLGQIMSGRPDMIPKAYCDELEKLCDDVQPMEFDEVRRVVEKSLGAPIEQVFSEFERVPLGAASIAQAHKARLTNGERVVVKVQREGIHDMMEQDIALMRHAAGLLKLGTGDTVDLNIVLDEMWVASQEEMDFLTEASNGEKFYRLNKDVKYVTCPRIYRNLTTRNVLVMEYIDGYAMADFESLKRAGYDLSEIGRKLADNYIKQITDDGFFHADPHMGNLMVRDGQIVFIDMGMMGRLSARDQALFTKGIRAVAQHDVESIANILLAMGKSEGHVDRLKLQQDVDDMLTKYGDASLGSMDMAKIMNEGMDLAKAHHIAMPAGVTMLVRGISTLEGVVVRLAPEVDIISVTAAHVAGSMFANVNLRNELGKIALAAMQSGRKALDLPSLLADTLRINNKGQSKLNLEMSASEEAQKGLFDLAFVLVMGLVASALILAGAIMAQGRAQLPPHSVGAFVLAAVICLVLVVARWRRRR